MEYSMMYQAHSSNQSFFTYSLGSRLSRRPEPELEPGPDSSEPGVEGQPLLNLLPRFVGQRVQGERGFSTDPETLKTGVPVGLAPGNPYVAKVARVVLRLLK